MIDAIAYRDDSNKELKAKLGYKDRDDLRVVSGEEYRKIEPESLGLTRVKDRHHLRDGGHQIGPVRK